MKKSKKVFISLVLVVGILMTSLSVPALAANESSKSYRLVTEQGEDITFGKYLITALGTVMDFAIDVLLNLFPDPVWVEKDEYTNVNFYAGHDEFVEAAQEDSYWSVGYSSASVVPDDFEERGYVTAGRFHFVYTPTYEIVDDQCVRVVALDDNSGRGKVVFVTIDGYGMTGTNVRKIRERLEDFAQKNNIISINVSLSHAHSCIDTHGLGAAVLEVLGKSYYSAALGLLGKDFEVVSTDEDFMNNLFEVSKQTVIDACNSMKSGTLTYNAFDVSELMYDKQLPHVYDTNINQIRFVPDDETENEIWLVNMGVHPVKMTGSGVVSYDYPGAMAKYLKETLDVDMAFVQGAELGITRREEPLDLGNNEEFQKLQGVEREVYNLNAYAKAVSDHMINDIPVESFEIEPFINIAHKELDLPVENRFLMFASSINMINNAMYNETGRIIDSRVMTEVGYCELGSRLSIAMVPGEIDPEIIWGGTRKAENAWNGYDWEYDSFEQIAGKDKKLIAFGLTNDQIGYIVPDNDFAHTFAHLFESLIGGDINKHYEEFISIGSKTASGLTEAFEELVDSKKEGM